MPAFRTLAGCRVAVVEDDPDALQAMLDLLHSWQIETLPADCASALLEALAGQAVTPGQEIDALITDLRLPGAEDGLALVQALRAQARFRQLPVLVVTADLVRQPSSQVDWLVKPVGAQQIHDWLQARLPAIKAGKLHTG